MTIRRGICAVALVLSVAACAPATTGAAEAGTAEPEPAAATLELVPSPATMEDLVEIPGRGTILASGFSPSAGGALHAIGIDSRRIQQLWPAPDGAPARVAHDAESFPGCALPPAAADASPHGLALTSAGERTRLYAVNHGSREAIEVFDVDTAGEQPRLTWVGCVELPEGTYGNGVAVDDEARVYVSNFIDPADVQGSFARILRGEPIGDVRTWTRDSGWSTAAGGTYVGANGVAVDARGEQLFVAEWGGRSVRRVDLATGETTTTAEIPYMPDNLRWGPDGALYTTGQDLTPDQFASCLTLDVTVCPYEGFEVTRISPNTLELAAVRRYDGTDFGHAATALPTAAGGFWIGNVFGPPQVAFMP
ncbi:hypothetical protein ACFQH9_12030 [Pseudonocardia lutea]|uniref:SMP-30/Gluconolactonase/LRE-like region domain-containing protein n=1 Tax=Pseudonocardia lutea TaxID=2172015 RepID=A0ABW1I7R3_9PSEU